MPFIDQIEMVRSAVEDGYMSLDDAARLLSERSDGGLTPLGARDVITDPVPPRQRYEAVFRQAEEGLRRLRGEF